MLNPLYIFIYIYIGKFTYTCNSTYTSHILDISIVFIGQRSNISWSLGFHLGGSSPGKVAAAKGLRCGWPLVLHSDGSREGGESAGDPLAQVAQADLGWSFWWWSQDGQSTPIEMAGCMTACRYLLDLIDKNILCRWIICVLYIIWYIHIYI